MPAHPKCFHCGLEVRDRRPPVLEVLGQERVFCCPGCQAVCGAIVRSGNEDYYRYREGDAANPADTAFQEHIDGSVLYDQEEVQRSFVQPAGDALEAYLLLEDIRCAACIWLNERHVRGLDGVLDVQADYAAHRLRVRWDPQRVALSDIIRAIARVGYIAHPYDARHSRELADLRNRRSLERILFAGILGMVVMHFSLASYIMGGPGDDGHLPLWQLIGRWTGLLIATAILAWPGQEFFVGAWRDLRGGRLGMDVPVVIGLGLAWSGSLWSTWRQSGDVYFDSIAMFVFLLLLSRHLELRGRVAAADRLDRLNVVIPEFAWRRDPAGRDTKVPVASLQAGDMLSVRPGHRIPLDGWVREGRGEVDESLITGEFAPVAKAGGDRVLGGSINGAQHLVIEATGSAANACVNRIADLARHGSMVRPRAARFSDIAARHFVRLILVLAALTAAYYGWQDPGTALEATIAVLIVTCPCALALATPVATSLSAGRLTEAGILALHMESLDELASFDTLILDKTGTMTLGQPWLEWIQPLADFDRARVLAVAMALERCSEHPLAKAFARHPETLADCRVDRFELRHAEGISGWVDGVQWRLGVPAKLAGTDWQERIAALPGVDLDRSAATILLLTADGAPAALFGVGDQVRPGVAATIRALQGERIGLHVLSGDTQASVDSLLRAQGLQPDQALGGLLPEDKLRYLRDLHARGRRVLMVGDGINDSPVLAHADVSLSFHGAPDLARVHSDFLITGNGFDQVLKARDIARRTRRIIFQNLAWAAGYNLLALPAAMAGLVPAWGAAIGMSLSSMLVVANSLRL